MTTEVEVWWVPLDRGPEERLRLEAVLSADERERADRFRTEKLRTRYCVAHGVLRHVLAAKLGRAPADFGFECGQAGKPAISSRHGPAAPHFNLSHSEDMALIAISGHQPVGIDIERHRKGIDVTMLAERYFAPGEARQIRSLPGTQQTHAFLVCWTRKEAYLKATGAGLSAALDSFEVSVRSGETPRLLTVAGDPQAASRWHLADLGNDDYAATLAIEAPGAKTTMCRFPAMAD